MGHSGPFWLVLDPTLKLYVPKRKIELENVYTIASIHTHFVISFNPWMQSSFIHGGIFGDVERD